MNPTHFARIEDAYENDCARMYGQYLDELAVGEELADIEQEFWGDLNFNDIGSALAEEGAIDEKAFVRAFGKGDAETVLSLLQDAVQAYIEHCAKNEYERRERELEIAAEEREELEIEEAEREWRMR